MSSFPGMLRHARVLPQSRLLSSLYTVSATSSSSGPNFGKAPSAFVGRKSERKVGVREFRVTPAVEMPRALPAWQQKRLGERKKAPVKKVDVDEDQEEDLVHEGEEEVMKEEDTVRAADADEEESGRSRWQGQDAGEEVGETERPKRPATMMEGVRAAREKMKREKEAKEEEARLNAEAETKSAIRKADSVSFDAERGKKKEGLEELEPDWRKHFVSDERGVDLDAMERMFRERMDKMKFSEEAEELLADWKTHVQQKRENRAKQVDNTEALAEAAKIAELGEEEWRERTRREEEEQEKERSELQMKRAKREQAPIKLEHEEDMRQRVLEEHASFFSDERPRNRKDKRRKVVQKAINHHLSLALRKKEVMKTRPDLEYLAEFVTLTDVVLSDDMSHARLIWASHVGVSPEREKEVNGHLTELIPAFRYTIAKGLNLRRCPSLSFRPDVVALSSLRVEDALHEHRSRLSAMGISMQHGAGGLGFAGGGAGGGAGGVGAGEGGKQQGDATLGFDPDRALEEMERRIEEFNRLSSLAPPSASKSKPPPASQTPGPRVNTPAPRSTTVEARVKRLLAQIQDDEPGPDRDSDRDRDADSATGPGRPAP